MKKTAFYYINALTNALLFATNTNSDEVKTIKQQASADGYDGEKFYNIAYKKAVMLVNNY